MSHHFINTSNDPSEGYLYVIHNKTTGDTAYATDSEGAVLAYFTLHDDAAYRNCEVSITNLATTKVVWSDG